MEKGQHIRLLVSGVIGSTYIFNALATELTLHLSAQTEDSTTKDTTDSDGNIWNEYDVMQRSGDIQFGSLLATGSVGSTEFDFASLIDKVSDTPVSWKICMVSGTNNRVVGKTICSGQGKLNNLQAQGQVNQKATYTGTISIYGPVAAGTD